MSNTEQKHVVKEPVLEVINGEEYEVIEEVVEEEEEVEEEIEEEEEEEVDTDEVDTQNTPSEPNGQDPADKLIETIQPKITESKTSVQNTKDDQKDTDVDGDNKDENKVAGDKQGSDQKVSEDGVMAEFNLVKGMAATAAKDVSARAKDLSSKVSSGLAKGFSQFSKQGGVANQLSNWWSSLDPKPQAAIDARNITGRAPSTELAQKLGLEEHENLMEEFRCKILQTLGCTHNDFTPPIQMAFPGVLYITDKRVCFELEERKAVVPKFNHSDVLKAARRGPARKGEKSDTLYIQLKENDKYVTFKDFDDVKELDGALGLIEHLMSEANPQTQEI